MKAVGRILIFFIFVALVAIMLYFRHGTPPFSAIPSKSMVPTFHVGDLVVIQEIIPSEVEKGDIIVVDVPGTVQNRFGYPPNIIHRVVEVKKSKENFQFRVKGDNNNAEDPFTVLPKYIMGTPVASYPYLGYPILFLNSKQGFYFLISALALYLLYVVFEELSKRQISLRRGISTFFFSDVFSRTKQIEEGQEKVIEMLMKKNHSFQPEALSKLEGRERLEAIRTQVEENRRLIREMEAQNENGPQYEALLETFGELDNKLEEILQDFHDSREPLGSVVSVDETAVSEELPAGEPEKDDELKAFGSDEQSGVTPEEFPPRREKKRPRGLFKRR